MTASNLRTFGAVLVVAIIVGAVALWPRGGDDPAEPGTSTPSSTGAPTSAAPSGTGTASDDEWCADFRGLADAQGEFAASGTAPPQLIEVAQELATLGLPQSMPQLAVGGWYTLLTGIFESLGATPPPGTFLDGPEPQQGFEAEDAFTQYTTTYCPAG